MSDPFFGVYTTAWSQCGAISLIGEFSGWDREDLMEQDPLNPEIYHTSILLTVDDDLFQDGINEGNSSLVLFDL